MLPLPARIIALNTSEGIYRADAHGLMCVMNFELLDGVLEMARKCEPQREWRSIASKLMISESSRSSSKPYLGLHEALYALIDYTPRDK